MIEAGGAAFVADLGSGAYANLARYVAPEALDGIFISHMHADHFLDIVPLRYALKYGARTNDRKLPLYLPPGGEPMLRRLCSAFAKETGDDFLGEVFDVRAYDPGDVLHVREAVVRFAPTDHFVPTFALRCTAGGGAFAFSSDTAPAASVTALARSADLFVCEATLSDVEANEPVRGHLSAREAGALALRAEVARLALTHYPATVEPAELARLASLAFPGPVTVVDDGDRLEF